MRSPSDGTRSHAARFVVTGMQPRPRIGCPQADVHQATAVHALLRERVRPLALHFLHRACERDPVDRNEGEAAAPAFREGKNDLAATPMSDGINHDTARALLTPRARAGSTFQSRETKPGSNRRELDPAGAVGPVPPSKSDREGCFSGEESFVPNATDQGGPR